MHVITRTRINGHDWAGVKLAEVADFKGKRSYDHDARLDGRQSEFFLRRLWPLPLRAKKCPIQQSPWLAVAGVIGIRGGRIE